MRKQLVFSAVIVLGALSVLLALPTREAQAQVVFQAAGSDGTRYWGPWKASTRARGAQRWPARDQLGRRRGSRRHGPGNPVRRLPEHPRRPVHSPRGRACRRRLRLPTRCCSRRGGWRACSTTRPTATIFSPFSPQRLFTPVGSNITEALFFVPGTNGATPQRSRASARSSRTSTSRMGAGLARSTETARPAR